MSEKIVVSNGRSSHGECTIIRADLFGDGNVEIPEDAVEQEADELGRLLVAHSESGHHHFVDGSQAKLYHTSNPLIKYLKVTGDKALLRHAKPESDPSRHHTQQLDNVNGGVYRIHIQREETPEGWRAVQD